MQQQHFNKGVKKHIVQISRFMSPPTHLGPPETFLPSGGGASPRLETLHLDLSHNSLGDDGAGALAALRDRCGPVHECEGIGGLCGRLPAPTPLPCLCWTRPGSSSNNLASKLLDVGPVIHHCRWRVIGSIGPAEHCTGAECPSLTSLSLHLSNTNLGPAAAPALLLLPPGPRRQTPASIGPDTLSPTHQPTRTTCSTVCHCLPRLRWVRLRGCFRTTCTSCGTTCTVWRTVCTP